MLQMSVGTMFIIITAATQTTESRKHQAMGLGERKLLPSTPQLPQVVNIVSWLNVLSVTYACLMYHRIHTLCITAYFNCGEGYK